jgi:deazaflavin-dependent oxidoreductase (nitroreductase family)
LTIPFQHLIDDYRDRAGEDGMALLTTTGARSGRSHTVPVGVVPDGDTLLLVASAAGAPRHPGWFHNLVANPRVTLETGDGKRITTRTAIAVPAAGEERDRLFDLVVGVAPGYADYQRQTSRVLPVVVLHPEGPDVVRVRAAGDELVAVHAWIRGELVALREGAAVAFTDDLRSNCLALCMGLDRHHMGEDNVMFSFLQQRFPELGPVLGELRTEHGTVAKLRGELSDLVSQESPAQAEFDRLDAELTAHLDREEALLVPLLNALPDVPWPKLG